MEEALGLWSSSKRRNPERETPDRIVHIATVGRLPSVNDDPYQISDPISFAIHQERYAAGRAGHFPDAVYLLYTAKPPPGSKEIAETLQKKLQKMGLSAEQICPEEIEPFDIEAVANKVAELIDQERRQGAKIVVNFTAGTAPMQVGAFAKAMEWRLRSGADFKLEIIYVQEFKGERPITVPQKRWINRIISPWHTAPTVQQPRGTQETMIIQSIEPYGLYYDHLFNRGLELFKKFDYERAETYFAQAENFRRTQEEYNQAAGYRVLCQAYSLWDSFVYSGAAGALRQAASYLEDQKELLEEKVEYVTKRVSTLKGGPSLFYTVDMLENAVREFVRGRPHEALLKAFRFFELVMEYQLAQAYNFFEPTRDKPKEANRWKEIAKQWGRRRKISAPVETLNKIRLGEEIFYSLDAEILLDLLGDSLYKSMVYLLNQARLSLSDLREARNKSSWYHGREGVKPGVVDPDKIKAVLQAAYRVLEQLKRKHKDEDWTGLERVLRPYEYDPLALLAPEES